MNKTQQPIAKKHRTPWRDYLISAGIFTCVLIGFFVWASYKGDDRPIRETAAQLKIDPSWKLIREKVTPPGNMCFKACPSLLRTWDADKQITLSEFESLIQQSSWDIPITKKCDPSWNPDDGGVPDCHAEGVDEGYYIRIYTSKSSSDSSKSSLTLSLNPNH